MRGSDQRSGELFSYVDIEARVPMRHPLRAIRSIVNQGLASLDGEFDKLYADTGRDSIPPERLLRAALLQAFFSIRSERLLMEQLNYNLLYRWFVGLGVDDAVWDHSVFSKNRDRLLETHASTTEAKLYKKGRGKQAKLCFMGQVLMENRHGLVVQADTSETNGTAERQAALEMVDRQALCTSNQLTLGADKAYDARAFVADLRQKCVTPRVARG